VSARGEQALDRCIEIRARREVRVDHLVVSSLLALLADRAALGLR